MTPADLPVGAFLKLAREHAAPVEPAAPIVVTGPLAPQLIRALADGGDTALVREGDGHEDAAVLVCVLAGDPSSQQRAVMRAATRRGTPLVAVQTGTPREIPYVPALDVVDCPPGQGFPVASIAAAIARVGGGAASSHAGGLPVLRDPVVRALLGRSAARAAAIAAWSSSRGSHLPLILAVQMRLLREVSAVTGTADRETPSVAGVPLRPELGLAIAFGLAGRSLLRALPSRGPATRAAVAAGATLALGAIAAARGSMPARAA
jgi:uncharacterized protein (DUF697 family)